MNVDNLAKETLEGRRNFASLVEDCLRDAKKRHPIFQTPHHGLAVIWEEFEEFKNEIFKKQPNNLEMLTELAQLGAMCQRFAEDLLKVK